MVVDNVFGLNSTRRQTEAATPSILSRIFSALSRQLARIWCGVHGHLTMRISSRITVAAVRSVRLRVAGLGSGTADECEAASEQPAGAAGTPSSASSITFERAGWHPDTIIARLLAD